MIPKSRARFRRHLARLAALLSPCAFAAAQDPADTAPALPPDLSQALAAAYRSGDTASFQIAAQALEHAVEAAPGDLELRKKLGFLYLENLHEPAKAVPQLEQVRAAQPDDAGWLQLLARACKEAHRYERAAALFRESAERNPGDVWPRYHLGWTLVEAGRKAEARTAFEQARAIEPANHYVLEALAATAPKAQTPLEKSVADADASGDAAQFRHAAELLEDALRGEPHHLANRKSLAFIYLEKLHDFPAALPHLRAVVAALPRDTAWLQMLAKAQADSGDWQAAAASYREAARRDPRDAWARYHLGRTLAKLDRPHEARAAFDEAHALDPRNNFVRIEIARLANSNGYSRQASELTRDVLHAEPHNADAHALLGDIFRADWDFSSARAEYSAALAAEPQFASAEFGLSELHKAQAPRASVSFYTFEDTEDFRQSGIFANVSVLMTGPLRVSLSAAERWFKKGADETVERFENDLSVEYRPSRWLTLAGGVSEFKTEDQSRTGGASVAVYFTPVRSLDLWASYRFHDPVSDTFVPAREGFTQDIVAGGATFRPTRLTAASITASSAEYSDGNTRRFALASVSYLVSEKFSTTAKLEYEWLDFDRHEAAYSSPENYTLLRPAIEASPRLTDWLRLQFRGELIYVFDEKSWGTGLAVGPRFNVSDRCEFGFQYLRYEIPGFQTNYSGEGFKIDLSCRF